MVLGLKKKKKGISLQVDYIVSVLEIKPWPPSVPLCSVQTVLIQWENGEHSSGFLPPGVPALNGFEDGKIEFHEFFKLQVTLSIINKNKTTTAASTPDKFQKNYLEFNLYEPRKEKAAKGQILGTASVNLAQYGIIRDMEMITAPIHIKKMSKGMTQPFLYLKIQPFDQEGIESVLKLMSEQCEDDSDLISFTDDEESTTSAPSASVHTPSDQDISPFKMDEVLNFVSMGLNSEASAPRVVQRQESYAKDDTKGKKQIKCSPNRTLTGGRHGTPNEDNKEEDNEHEDPNLIRSSSVSDRDVFTKFTDFATKTKSASRSNTYKFGRKTSVLLKNNKSVRYPSESSKCNIDRLSSFHSSDQNSRESTSSTKSASTDVDVKSSTDKKSKKSSSCNDDKIKAAEWESKIQMLEEELREAAAVEVSLYSVAAEHVNSKRKVHAPARRISRFYRHVCSIGSITMRASVARTTISGLVVVAKASGNDVSRLTFWLSNSIVLRATVSLINKEFPPPPAAATATQNKGREKKSTEKKTKQDKNSKEAQDDWEDPLTFIISLEKIEAWIFSRIIESIWWQSFTPHMQTIPKKKKGRRAAAARKTQKWRFCLGDQEQGKFSINLWKKAFQDAWKKLCPVRANGHDCGCLPVLSKSMMEQLVNRLDVAMFNAILRESDDTMPTDPVSDPISDPKVLPIPSGRSSFGAGAQLKNAVGNWSSSLTGFFHDQPDKSDENKKEEEEASYKAFRLLNALSNLMMLPLGMLSDGSTRKEVCPLLGAPIVKRILENFVPDDFAPAPIPESLLQALDSEDPQQSPKEAIKCFPYTANPIIYSPVPVSELSSMIADERNSEKQENGASSILRKSYSSDDDLEKMNSPIASINVENIQIAPASSEANWMPQGIGGRSVVRYRLLQEAWKSEA